jgi:hypothetical protein
LIDFYHLLVDIISIVTSVREADAIPFHGIFFPAKDACSWENVILAAVPLGANSIIFIEVFLEDVNLVSER